MLYPLKHMQDLTSAETGIDTKGKDDNQCG
jgi:hypothetical protein